MYINILIDSKDTTWFKRSHIIQRISYEIINLNSTLLNHSSSWGQIFVGKQIFADSWGRYFVGKLGDVTRENDSYLIYLQTTENLSFLYFNMLQNRVIFPVNTSMRPGTLYCGEVKPPKGLSSAMYCKTMITIKKLVCD